jgi:cytochrome c
MKLNFLAAALLFSSAMYAQSAKAPEDIQALLQKHNCVSCHKVDKKAIGPAWSEIAKKAYSAKQFTALVYKPVPENWPTYTPAMTALPKVPKGDLSKISAWVTTLK